MSDQLMEAASIIEDLMQRLALAGLPTKSEREAWEQADEFLGRVYDKEEEGT